MPLKGVEVGAAETTRATGRGDHPVTRRWEIFSYFSVLTLALGLGSPSGVAAIPIGYILKDELHLSPLQLATFVAITSAPAYVGFLFGFVRDRWRPPWGDRGYLFWGALVAVGCYVWLSAAGIGYFELLCLILIASIAYLMLYTAASALMTEVAQARLMTGRLSVIALLGSFIPAVISGLGGGWLVAHISAHGTFVVAGCPTMIVLLQAFWRPSAIVSVEETDASAYVHMMSAIRRLIAHRPIWPAALIYFLWNFSPGFQTPIFYHLTETVKISSQTYGIFIALQWGCYLPTTILYGLVCQRMRLSLMLRWGTLAGLLQVPWFFFVRSAATALEAGAAIGIFGGFVSAAYLDLLMRSCPKGLEGTGMMLATTTALATAVNTGNLLGSWLYSRGGFALAIIVTILATALIFPVLRWVPASVTSSREGEPLHLIAPRDAASFAQDAGSFR